MISGMHTFQVLDSLALLPSPYFEVVLHMHCEYPANTAQQAKASAVPIGTLSHVLQINSTGALR